MEIGPLATRTLAVQAAACLLLAAGWLVAGPRAALAALAGGACIIVPGAVFAARAARAGPGSSPHNMLKAFFSGAVMRLVLAAALLFLLVPVFADGLLPLMTTLVAMLAAHWAALIWGTDRRDGEL